MEFQKVQTESRVRFTVEPRPPYSLALTAARFARFPEAVDRFDGRTYRRLLPARRGVVLMHVAQSGPLGRPRLAVTLEGAEAKSEEARGAAERVLERSLNAGFDVRPFYRAFGDDPLLGAPIRDFRGLRIAGVPSLWEALVTAVLSQQVNLLFAYDIRRELALSYGRRARFDGDIYATFPEPERLAEESPDELRRFRLSEAKAEALVRIARAFGAGEMSEEELSALPDSAAIERLMSFKGVGRWTAEIALLRGLGRADVFPAADLGVVKHLALGFLGRRAPSSEVRMRRFAERWRPWRGLALAYAYAELNRRKASPRSYGPRIAPRRAPRPPRASETPTR